MSSFKVGQRVDWVSAKGRYHIGKIVERIPAGKLPSRGKPKWGLYRKEISFLVEAGARLYWPETSRLRLSAVKGSRSDERGRAGRIV